MRMPMKECLGKKLYPHKQLLVPKQGGEILLISYDYYPDFLDGVPGMMNGKLAACGWIRW